MVMKTRFATYKDVFLKVGTYVDGSIAIQVWNYEDGPIASLTVCLYDRSLEAGEAYIDTNNCPLALEFIKKEKLGVITGRIGRSGYCTYPVVKFDMEKVEEKAR